MFCLGCIGSAIDLCKAGGVTQTKIVQELLRSLDPQCGEVTNEEASNINRGQKNPSVYVMDAVAKINVEQYSELVSYFKEKIIVLIKENARKLIKDTLVMIIQEDSEIGDDTVVEIISGIKKVDLASREDDLATFLAGVFLYALKNTKNNVGGTVKRNVKTYIEKNLPRILRTIKECLIRKNCDTVRELNCGKNA